MPGRSTSTSAADCREGEALALEVADALEPFEVLGSVELVAT